ncbi:GNAT family N-acetyltransferase [Actinotalea sp. K2]|uniref:GNAT family N-acetyltransferase n=1 Tax=Actinotalea sp. K2 TaxID=2939438 RepID=UPI002016B084|nr:GNAT family N-acetyltransferase [Actinotalea sp. K2]MCL3862190.1 GNAT family N-acetyltransferase [Actinotalea sp. K2]
MPASTDDAREPAVTPGYPTHWEADVVLRDGGTAHVRPIRRGDAAALQAFHVGQSERSTYFRFFAPLSRLPQSDLDRFTQVDHHDRVALVAVSSQMPDGAEEIEPGRDVDQDERIIAVGRYDRTDAETAEVAFNVADDHHGRGLGSVLLEHLAAAARERGISRFTAEVLPQNGQMIGVFREAGYVVAQHLDDGIVSVSFDIDPTERSLAVMADREHRAEARSVQGILDPRSVLVVARADSARSTGPGGARTGLAQAVLDHLLAGADAPHVDGGPAVHVVGPLRAPAPAEQWDEIAQVPGPVDLLVLEVPAASAAATVRQCARLTPRAVVVLSSGFAETGPDGLAHQRDLVRAAHAAGMRVVGPSSYGFLRRSQGAGSALNLSLHPRMPSAGTVGLFCQSAPLAVGMLGSARRRGLGLSTFLSAGNRADVSGNDLMQFWTEDDQTTVVGLYLESIGNPRKFARVARRLASTKPVVVLTAGRTGHVVPAGHAVRVTKAPRRTLEEMLRQAGVIRVDNTHQLLDVTQLLAHQPLPAGRRVSVLASSEPLAALVAEAAASAGLIVSDRRGILAGLGDDDADLAALDAELAQVYADPACDVVVVVHVPTVGAPDPRIARAVAHAAAGSGRTTVACILGLTGVGADLSAPDASGAVWTVPAYAAAEDGVLALAAAARYSAWRAAGHGQPLHPEGVDRPRARRLVESHLESSGGDGVSLAPEAAAELLACYGLGVWPTRVVRTPAEAVGAAEELGWPVALKSTAAHLRHRIDLGGVRLDIGGPAALVDHLAQMQAHLSDLGVDASSFEVQRMAPAGAACVIRTSEDPLYGALVSFGLAGDAVDLLGDVSYGVAPLTDVDVSAMVRSIRAAPRLFGYRGLPALDVEALEEVLARVSVLADDLPEVRSLELHPVVVAETGAAVLTVRVELAEAGRADGGRRSLPQ